MQHADLDFTRGFDVAIRNERSQAAVMVIKPGGHEGGTDNRHRGADQWLFVVGGSGLAIVDGHEVKLEMGSILLIEAGEGHEIRNTGTTALKTLNLYVPPAYDADGDELDAGKR
jgi:mannose-6-phosphate isomerase-like protein (cupin superfamily)